jgi:hypothetical protein
MPEYIYRCVPCEEKLAEDNSSVDADTYDAQVLFETSHSMSAAGKELADALKCPRCGASRAERFYGYDNIISYVRGNGYLDRAGARRDMHKHTLVNNDPYGHMRQPGEVEDLKIKLDQAGKHDPKPRHFVMGAKTT